MTREEFFDYLSKHAPDMKIGKARELADMFHNYRAAKISAEDTIGILSESVIGIDENGNLPEHLVDHAVPAVRMALKNVQYIHGMIVCGHGTSMEQFMERMNEEASRKKQ
jgi:hypothetical protein